MTTVQELQTAIGTKPDGAFGELSRKALVTHFVNASPAKVTDGQIAAIALRLGCSAKQIRAVGQVESSGSGFDRDGRPKILFERHIFHRLTGGVWSPSLFSQSDAGGYSVDSWVKLGAACAKDPDAAFSACSWGKFQVLGTYWDRFGFQSPYALAYSTVTGEAAHYELLALYVEKFGLADELRALSIDSATCRAFAKGYNGPAYEAGGYHLKLAAAMA